MEQDQDEMLCGWSNVPLPTTRKPALIEPDLYNDEHVSTLERWQDRYTYDFARRGR